MVAHSNPSPFGENIRGAPPLGGCGVPTADTAKRPSRSISYPQGTPEGVPRGTDRRCFRFEKMRPLISSSSSKACPCEPVSRRLPGTHVPVEVPLGQALSSPSSSLACPNHPTEQRTPADRLLISAHASFIRFYYSLNCSYYSFSKIEYYQQIFYIYKMFSNGDYSSFFYEY